MRIRNLVFALATIIGICSARAQEISGSWKVIPRFNGVEGLVDTDDMVYYISASQLYSYDKNADETYNYSTGNRLSDNIVEKIFYDYDNDLLAVTFEGGNIDLIDSNDRVYNLPDIKDANLSVVPNINFVSFSGNKMYVATSFGIVVFDTKRHEVITSGDYRKEIATCAVWGDWLLLVDRGALVSYIGKDEDLTSYDKLKLGFGLHTTDLLALNDSILVSAGINNDKTHIATVYMPESGRPENPRVNMIVDNKIINVLPTKDGGAIAKGVNYIYQINGKGDIKPIPIAGSDLATQNVDRQLENKYLSAWKGLKDMWVGDYKGVARYSLDDDNRVTLLSAPAELEGLTMSVVGRLYTSPTGKIYVTSWGEALMRNFLVPEMDKVHHVNIIENGVVTNATPLEFDVQSKSNPSIGVTPRAFRRGNAILEDPNDPDAYYISSSFDGIYHIKDRKQIGKYYEDNSTIESNINGYCVRVLGMDFDPRGNLWATQHIVTGETCKLFHVLRKENLDKPSTPDLWESFYQTEIGTEAEQQVLASRHSNTVIYKDAVYHPTLLIVNTKGTSSTSDDVVNAISDIIDQDNKIFEHNYLVSLAEDNNGHIWVGTDNGVFEIVDPGSVSGTTLNVNHIKVPRNDGSNFADYLLNGEFVLDIAVDHANRKWLATQGSGVYLVSETGDKILKHFDTTNSPLPSDIVTAVTCGLDNKVYIGTIKGLVEYTADSAPARDDYSEVYAFPNPVRPEYSGWITITGLMDNSLVKIGDAAGNILYQGTSQGGMITWDGCDRSGHRVKTGVYYVFASSGLSGEETHGAVTKILVVN